MYDIRLDRRNDNGALLRQDTTSQTLDSNKFAGYNFTVGFKYNGEQLSAGLLIRTPFDLTVNTVRSIFDVNQYNGLTIDAGTDTTYFEDIKVKYQMPLMLGLGLAYKLDERTTLAADFEYRGFDGQKIRVRDSILLDPGGSNTEYYTDVDPGWKNVFVVRGGVERILESDFARIPVRLGGGYIPLPAPNITDYGTEKQTSSSASSFQISLGAGLWWEQIHLDVAYTFTQMDWDYVYMGDHGTHITRIDQDGDPELIQSYFNGGMPYTQKTRDHHLNVTFTGYF
jgi:long-subunit fatty acid transport protein